MNYIHRHKGWFIALAIVIVLILIGYVGDFHISITPIQPVAIEAQDLLAQAAGADRGGHSASGSTMGGVTVANGSFGGWRISADFGGRTVSVMVMFGGNSSGTGSGRSGTQNPYGGMYGGQATTITDTGESSGGTTGGGTPSCKGKECDTQKKQN